MPHDLPKAYDPTAIEDHWAGYWVREKQEFTLEQAAAHRAYFSAALDTG